MKSTLFLMFCILSLAKAEEPSRIFIKFLKMSEVTVKTGYSNSNGSESASNSLSSPNANTVRLIGLNSQGTKLGDIFNSGGFSFSFVNLLGMTDGARKLVSDCFALAATMASANSTHQFTIEISAKTGTTISLNGQSMSYNGSPQQFSALQCYQN